MRTTFTAAGIIAAVLWSLSTSAAEQAKPSGRMVEIEVVIAEFASGAKGESAKLGGQDNLAERVGQWEKEGKFDLVTRIRLSSIEGNVASAQVGERLPMAAGRARNNTGGQAYVVINMGTLISATPQVEPDGSVVVELQIEKSRPGPRAPRDDPNAVDSSPQTVQIQCRSTVRIPPGTTVVASSSVSSAETESGQYVILVSAKAAPPRSDEAAKPELKVFSLTNLKAGEAVKLVATLFREPTLKISADERTNTVIVLAPREQMDVIGAVLLRLDEAKSEPKKE